MKICFLRGPGAEQSVVDRALAVARARKAEAIEVHRDDGASAVDHTDLIVTLGGDGTNRVVAKGCGNVPITPISTGTNNVFPKVVEGIGRRKLNLA